MIGHSTARRLLRVRIAVLAPTVLLALGAVLPLAHAGRSAPPSVAVVAKEFLFDPQNVTAGTGAITFVVQNRGEIDHSFVIETPGGKTLTQVTYIEPGETRAVTATLPAGTYIIYCSLPGHRDAGMVATLRVRP
jgi:uncharacterized cupredoxin-like copper-binding protein